MKSLAYEGKWDQLTPLPCQRGCPYHWATLDICRMASALWFVHNNKLMYNPAYRSVYAHNMVLVILRMYGNMTSADWYQMLVHWAEIPLVRRLLQTGRIRIEHPEMVELAFRYLFDKDWQNLLFREFSIPVNLLNAYGETFLYHYIVRRFKDAGPRHPDDDLPIPPFLHTLFQLGADPLLPNRDGETVVKYVYSLVTFPRSKDLLIDLLEKYA